MDTKNIEREFKIEVIASIIENRLLCETKDLFELCSFITDEYIDEKNLFLYINKVKDLILEFHPELNHRIIYYRNEDLYNIDIETLINNYRNKYGDMYKIKSLKKGIIRILKNQDK